MGSSGMVNRPCFKFTSAEYCLMKGLPSTTSACILAIITSTGHRFPPIMRSTCDSPCTSTGLLFIPHSCTVVWVTAMLFKFLRHLKLRMLAELPVSIRHLRGKFSSVATTYGKEQSVALLIVKFLLCFGSLFGPSEALIGCSFEISKISGTSLKVTRFALLGK